MQKYFQTCQRDLSSRAVIAEPMEEFQAVACIHRFHVFKDIWEAALSKESMCERESHNQRDRYVKCSLQINIRAFAPRKYFSNKNLPNYGTFCVSTVCEIQLASYSSKHASQCLSDKLFVCTNTHNLKLQVMYGRSSY